MSDKKTELLDVGYFLLSGKGRCRLTPYQLEKRCQNVQDTLNHAESQSDEKNKQAKY